MHTGHTVIQDSTSESGIRFCPEGGGQVAPPCDVDVSCLRAMQVPHRWKVVWMMFLSFILCNMDKVSRRRRHPLGSNLILSPIFLLDRTAQRPVRVSIGEICNRIRDAGQHVSGRHPDVAGVRVECCGPWLGQCCVLLGLHSDADAGRISVHQGVTLFVGVLCPLGQNGGVHELHNPSLSRSTVGHACC